MPRPDFHRRMIRLLLWTALAALAARPGLAAPITPTDAQKEMAAAIAGAPAPAEAAAAHQSDWTPGLAVALIGEGAAREAKDPAAAEAIYRLSRDVASKTHDASTEALALSKLGNYLRTQLAFPESIAVLRQALAMQTSAADNDQTSAAAETCITLMLALNDSGLSEEANGLAAQAVELATASGSELLLGRAYSAAGSAALNVGNHRAAVSCLQKALAVAEKLKSLPGQAAVLNNLGNASRQAFDFDAAAGYFQRSLEIKRQQGPAGRLSSTLNNLGELALVQTHFDEAEKYFQLSADAIRTTQEELLRPGVFLNLGLVAQGRGELDKALGYMEQSTALAEKLGDSTTFAFAHAAEADVDIQLRRLADAQSHLDKARKPALESGDPSVSMRLAIAQADIYRNQGLIPQARAGYLEAIRQFEARRLNVAGDESTQAGFADNTRQVYTSLIDFDASLKQNSDAFHYAELSKSRVLLDDLNSGRADVMRVLTPAEAKRNKELLGSLSDLNIRLRSTGGAGQKTVAQQIDKVRFDYSSFRTGVYATHPELALRRADPEPVTIARAAALLPDEHTALISYSVGEHAAYAFAITRVGGKPVLRVYGLKTDEDKLAAMVKKWRDQIAGRELGFTALASQLYDTLVKPLQPGLAAAKIDRLIVSPDSSLWQIPFEALQNGEGRFLTEDYEIFYVPSVTVLDRMRSVSAQRNGPFSLLALGDPTGDLPEAAAEVTGIGRLYPPGRAKVLTGSAATEAALRSEAGRYSVIHIAAHGRYDDSQPLYSYLALAPGKTGGSTSDDGNLEAREIMDLHFNARLVILSGCETARGSGAGEGIAGMSWSLFIAGAPATVASLWKVDSRSTAQLMTELHKGLAKGETTAKALRDAKLALLGNPAYRHPFYWAGFIGIGAGI
jgi:CHAT domain-containing protein/tetratricopeptide (TPR) repeat protein